MPDMKTTLLLASTLLALAVTASPAAADSRVFELRTYHAAPGKLAALNARFREQTLELFKKHGMTVVGFWVPADADKGSADTLVYLLAFKDREAAAAAWKAFAADPEWARVKAESEKDGPLATKVESVFLMPTDYSPMK